MILLVREILYRLYRKNSKKAAVNRTAAQKVRDRIKKEYEAETVGGCAHHGLVTFYAYEIS